MKRKVTISQREMNRRQTQRHRQWEKDNPAMAHALKELVQRADFDAQRNVEGGAKMTDEQNDNDGARSRSNGGGGQQIDQNTARMPRQIAPNKN